MVQLLTSDPQTGDFEHQWSTFIQHKVNSFTKWDLLRFFHDNPHTLDTADNIAICIGRETSTVNNALEGLVRSGILERDQRSSTVIYQLSRQAEIRKTLADFMRACHNRDFRARAIRLVIQSKQRA